jgi:hypothetical protein
MTCYSLNQALPLSPDVKHINPNGVAALALDVDYLVQFVSSLENGQMLRENLDELAQTIALLQTDNQDEFFDISTRNKKYGRVDALNGPMLLEKYVQLHNHHHCFKLLTKLQVDTRGSESR